VPARLGHIRFERKLGEGGMGVVYAAATKKLHRTVALKTMSSLAHDETARKRFWREAAAAAAVNHPNICQIYEIGEDEGVLFIAMELLEGTRCPNGYKAGRLASTEAVSTGLGMLNALSALHARAVIHRDLKPSNVFLTPHGVKLLDFGLARPTVNEQRHRSARSHARRRSDGHAALHVAGTGARRDARRRVRSVRDRRHPVRDARRQARVHGQHRGRDSARHGLRAAAGAERIAGGRLGRSRHPPRAGQESR
jgi:serine/threonine protein kinase